MLPYLYLLEILKPNSAMIPVANNPAINNVIAALLTLLFNTMATTSPITVAENVARAKS